MTTHPTPEALAECPFCGSADVKLYEYPAQFDHEPSAFVQCKVCGTGGPEGKSGSEAIAKWSSRPAHKTGADMYGQDAPSSEAWHLVDVTAMMVDAQQRQIAALSAELAAAIESNTALRVEAGKLHSMGVADLNKIQSLTAERDSLRAERDDLARWKSTLAPRIEALQGLKDHAQAEAAKGAEALASLASEREANAILTADVEALRAEVDRLTPKPLTDEQIDRIAENCAKAMPDGIRGFCVTWGWRQFARELLDVCADHARTPAPPVAEGV
jgi:Lar family restriction alleviation protein